MTTARSLHIGLNHVNPASYNGWNGELSGCINDAQDMNALATGLNYKSVLLVDADANSSRVVAELGSAAKALEKGDILLVTYSGHGGQVEDVNYDEEDRLDETWCLWDRQLIDDELYRLWSQFNPGVRIVVLSDSCHSGTVLRMLSTLNSLRRDMARSKKPDDLQQTIITNLTKALALESAEVDGNLRSAVDTMARIRGIPPGVQDTVNRIHRNENDAAQYLAGPSKDASVLASVILISGCQDDQVSADGDHNGLFTEKLKSTWGSGAFKGSYRDFWQAICSVMPRRQQPNYQFVGAENPLFESQVPFSV